MRLSSNITYNRFKGSQNLKQRLLLATLSSTPILIEDIRTNEMSPGLLPHEVSLLHLFEKVTDDCIIQINETGTKLKYKPGIVMGGRNLVHDCDLSRSIGCFLEPLILLCLFGKKPLSIRLKEGLGLKIVSRGVPPHGGGEVLLTVPIIQHLTAVEWIDEGMIQKIGGTAFTTKVGVRHGKEMIHAARGIFNHLLPDVWISSDHVTGPRAGNSPGYGISMFAKSTSGCFIAAETSISYPRKDETGDFVEEKNKLIPAADIGEQVASLLLEEIKRGGVVDSRHQGLLFLLCALCPEDVSKVRVGMLSQYGIQTH